MSFRTWASDMTWMPSQAISMPKLCRPLQNSWPDPAGLTSSMAWAARLSEFVGDLPEVVGLELLLEESQEERVLKSADRVESGEGLP